MSSSWLMTNRHISSVISSNGAIRAAAALL